MEGHTDSRPYGNRNYTNWELSADRANAARRLMEDPALNQARCSEVRGYADRHLLNPANPNDDRNRRVSVVVRYLDKDQAKPSPMDLFPQAGAKKGRDALPKVMPPPPGPPVAPVLTPIPGIKPPEPVSLPARPAPTAPKPAPETKPAAPGSPPAAPALSAPLPAGKTSVAPLPGKEEKKEKPEVAKTPTGPVETKPGKGPLEDNLGLQKEILNLAPQPQPIHIK